MSGDATIDWTFAARPTPGLGDRLPEIRASWQSGGAALLADLIRTIASAVDPAAAPVRVRAVGAPPEPIAPGDGGLSHRYAVCSPFRRGVADKGPATAWRIDSFLGVERALTDEALRTEWQHLAAGLPAADVVVLDDAALGFRDLSDPRLWQRAFAKHQPWVVLRQGRPVASGPLWEHLLAVCPDRLIVVLTIDDLRGRDIQVSRELSWERTAQDLLWELVHKPSVSALSRVALVVVSFGLEGAALVSAPGGDASAPSCTLFFDPAMIEGMWSAQHPGRITGGTECLTAALVREIAIAPATPRFERAVQAGVAAARRVHLDGYRERGPDGPELDFPLAAVVDEMQAGRDLLQAVMVPDPSGSDRDWTILEDRCTGNLAAKAAEIARLGPERALAGVPLGRFGKLVTADRGEIEAFRSVGALIAEYARDPQARPLSIGVFGPPGSGKSFGVKQVARAVARDLIGDPIEFNLAQLRSPDELADAFHLVRDESLAGRIPLVFWDEFDTALDREPLGWLKYFLAPMQDGAFRQGQLTHPIGRSVFVFAGGTCARVEDFVTKVGTEPGRQAKGPDFVSRLKGYVNVLGPNPQGERDGYSVIRRAILLRSILERGAPGLFDRGDLDIDPGVLRAFLETREYRHGARSLEAVVAMSRLSGKRTYERSSLPPEPQLELHVDARDFLALVQRPDLEGDLLDRLARAAHDVYRDSMFADGYVYGEAADQGRKVSSSLVDYDQLPSFKQEENRGTVRAIPAKLATLGCVMVPARAGLPPFELAAEELDRLAQDEHERWMRDLGPGWRHGTPTDKTHRIHEAYLPWEDLPEHQRDKDRTLVRGIPAILQRAGYTVVRTGASNGDRP